MNDTTDLAKIEGSGPCRRVEVKRIIKAPITKVWNALVNTNEVAQWWQAGEIEPHEGGIYKIYDKGEYCSEDIPMLDGKIRVFMLPNGGIVRYDLLSLDDKTTLLKLINIVSETDLIIVSVGWHSLTDNLEQYTTTGQPIIKPDDHRLATLANRYEKLLANF